MRLIDLEPRWLSPDVFMFKSPNGRGDWLTCKRIPMASRDQMALLWPKDGCRKGWPIVPTVPEMAWKFEGDDFATMTVTPSLDCSASGNWHGFITAGEIVTA